MSCPEKTGQNDRSHGCNSAVDTWIVMDQIPVVDATLKYTSGGLYGSLFLSGSMCQVIQICAFISREILEAL